MDVICLDEDDEIQQLQKELAELQKEREKYAKELKKRHLRNEIEKLKNENLQLKTKLIENTSQAHAEKDNDVKPFVVADKGIKKPAGSPGSGQDKSIKNPTGSQEETGNKRSVGRPRKRPSSPDVGKESLPEIEIEPGYMSRSMNSRGVKLLPCQEDVKEHASQAHAEKDNDVRPYGVADKSIKKPAGSPGSGQDKSIKKPTGSQEETGNKRSVGRPRKRPSSPDVTKESLSEIEIEPGDMSRSMNSGGVKLLPCQEDVKDCKDNEDNCNTLKENYIWNKNGSPPFLCNLCDFTCEYFLAIYNHLRKEHKKAGKTPNKDKPGVKSTSFDSGNGLLSANLSKRLPTKTRSSVLRRASDYSVEERRQSGSAVKQTFDHSHKETRRSSEGAVRHISEEKQPSSSSAFRRTSDHSNEERRKSTGSAVRQTSEEKQQSSGSAVRQTSDVMREERQKTSDRATIIKSGEPKGPKTNTSVAHLFRQIPKGYECNVCQEVYHSYIVVYNHVIKQHAEPRYRCKYCAYKVYERHKLIKHCKNKHRGRKLAFIELGNEHQKNKSHTKEDGDSDIINVAATAKDTDNGNKDPSDCESDDNNNTESDDESGEKSEDDKSKSGRIASLKDKILKTSRGFKCGVCGHQTVSYQGLHKHYLINHKEKTEAKFKCSFCSYTTNQRRYCIIHMKKAHKGKPIIYRTVGGAQKTNKTVVSAHKSQQLTITDYITRTAKGFKCTLCGIKAEEYHKTRYHVYYQHFAIFVCPYCEYKSSKRPQVVAHGKKLHPGKPLKITWHVKFTTRKQSIKVGGGQENRKKNNSSEETGNKRSVGRPRKRPSSPNVAKESLPEIKIEPGYMSISMNSKRVKLLPCQENIKDIKRHLNDEVNIKVNDEVSIKMEPHDPEQSDVRLLPNVYIDKDELYEFALQVNEPVADGLHVEQEMPILSSTTLVEEDPVPVSSTTVDGTPDEVDEVREDVTPVEVDEAREDVTPDEVDMAIDVTPDKVDMAREYVTPDEVDMARKYVAPDEVDMARKYVAPDKVNVAVDVTPDKVDMAKEDVTPDEVDMAKEDVTLDEVDMARKGEEDHPSEKSDREKENTAESGELDLDMEVESVEMEHGKKPSDSKHRNTEKKKDDGKDSDDILSPRMCMLIDQNEVWEIRVEELQYQPGVQTELPQAKIKVEKNEEEEVAGLVNSI